MMKIRQMQGFTLIEVMVALVIFALGFTAVITMTTGSVGSNAQARAMSGSAETAAEWVEVLTALPYNDTLLQDTVDPAVGGVATANSLDRIRNPMPAAGAFLQGFPDPVARPAEYTRQTADRNFTIYWNVAEGTPIPKTKTLMVIVTSTGLGPQKTVVLQHIIPER